MAVRVVFVRSKSPAGIEPRIAKEAASLARAGYDVHAILWDREGAHPREETRDGIRIHRVSLRAPEGRPSLILRVPGWWIRLVLRILRLRPDVVHAVDFDTVIPAYFAARIRGAPLVYDVFDFYADMVTASIPPWVRGRLASAERRMVTRADAVIVPDLRRSEQFGAAQPKRLIEIMNVPEDRGLPPTKEDPDGFVVFYGGMIAKDRGLKDLVAACEDVGAKLIVAGHGPDEAQLLGGIESSHAAMYLGTISYQEVLEQTAACQLVAALYDPSVPNNKFAAPNKLFEAMMLGKPVLTSEGTLAAHVVREVGCGIVVQYGDRAGLNRALETLMLAPEEAKAMGARGRDAFESRYNWKAMEPRLRALYGDLMAVSRNSR
jgi:glycosyltransferase involved in cell wall biosynthesis